jgi:hypothetical protein
MFTNFSEEVAAFIFRVDNKTEYRKRGKDIEKRTLLLTHSVPALILPITIIYFRRSSYSATLKMEATRCSETSVTPSRLQGATSQKAVFFLLSALETSNAT